MKACINKLNKAFDYFTYLHYKVVARNRVDKEIVQENVIDNIIGQIGGLLGVLIFLFLIEGLNIIEFLKAQDFKPGRYGTLLIIGIVYYLFFVIPFEKYLEKRLTIEKLDSLNEQYNASKGQIRLFMLYVFLFPLLLGLTFVAILYVRHN